jgi:hypothetical protein
MSWILVYMPQLGNTVICSICNTIMKIPYGVSHTFVTCHFRDLLGNYLKHIGVFPDMCTMVAIFLHENGL